MSFVWTVDYACETYTCAAGQAVARLILLLVVLGLFYLMGLCHCDWVLQWTDAIRSCSCEQRPGRPRRSLCPKRGPPECCGGRIGGCVCCFYGSVLASPDWCWRLWKCAACCGRRLRICCCCCCEDIDPTQSAVIPPKAGTLATTSKASGGKAKSKFANGGGPPPKAAATTATVAAASSGVASD